MQQTISIVFNARRKRKRSKRLLFSIDIIAMDLYKY